MSTLAAHGWRRVAVIAACALAVVLLAFVSARPDRTGGVAGPALAAGLAPLGIAIWLASDGLGPRAGRLRTVGRLVAGSVLLFELAFVGSTTCESWDCLAWSLVALAPGVFAAFATSL